VKRVKPGWLQCALPILAAILACSLAATAAMAAAPKPLVSGELVKNGGAEVGKAVSDSGSTAAPTSWTTTGNFTAVKYGAPGGFPDAAASRAISGGRQFFAGGPTAPSATATQTVSIPSAFRKPGLKVTARLSAALGGYSSQADDASVTATFMSSDGSTVGKLTIKPVTQLQRRDTTKLIAASKTMLLPKGTTSVTILITARPLSGGYVDGYADNVSLRLTA
jgi:hypothetical protein